MPTDSALPRIDILNVDLWGFLFERKDREFPDNKGTSCNLAALPRRED
jgi:4-coumarate--CoA ligase